MIKAQNLYFTYTGTPPYVLDDITLDIKSGEYVSVVGDNGCGKTTLMRLILNFLTPSSGTVTNVAKRIGYVPQKSENSGSGFPITVYEALNSYRKLLKIKDKNVIPRSLERVGMEGFFHALMGTLSGGQSQKILLARAMLGSPDLLILDEPSTGVDIHSQRDIYSFLKGLNKNSGVTIVSVEHNLDAAITSSTQIYHMRAGHGHLCTPSQYADEILNRKRDGR